MRLKKDGTPAKKPGRKPDPNKPVKAPGNGGRGPRPHVWVCGPDEYKHSMYMPWQRASAQARFRNEGWDLSFEQFYELWKDEWNNRGRQPDNMCMTRDDYEGAWEIGNVTVVTRREHLQRQQANRHSPGYKGPKCGRPLKPITPVKVRK